MFDKGALIKVNGTVHKISDVTNDTITITNIGEQPKDYVKRGIDNGKITLC